MTLHFPLTVLLASVALVAMPALASSPAEARLAATEEGAFEADRAEILAMAGDYKVTFDMRETTPWKSGYTPIPAKVSGGHESVRVIEDSGRRIVLQHFLVATNDKGESFVIKHWRQDWAYEPETMLVYAGKGRWNVEAVPASVRSGRWSQTVWQTDDSPRYAGWGQWTEMGGVRRWESNRTWRPLARRDAVQNPAYDRYLGINRHSPSPAGWIHWQDNIKMGPETAAADAKMIPFVQETVLNSYVKDAGYDVAAADAYWQATRDYWAAIRAAWDKAITKGNGVTVAEVADTGSAGAERLMGLADDIQAGKITTAAAVRKGEQIISEVTR